MKWLSIFAIFVCAFCTVLFFLLTVFAVPYGYRFPEQTVHTIVGVSATILGVVGCVALFQIQDWVKRKSNTQEKAEKS